jgi:hypothetical protein
LVSLFGRSSTPADLEDAVHRRIVGSPRDPQPPNVAAPTSEPAVQRDTASVDENPSLLLRILMVSLKRTGVEISTVKAGAEGFLVNGALEGACFEQWYSMHEVRQLAIARKVGEVRAA